MSEQEEDQRAAVGDRGEPTRTRQEEGEEEEDSDGKEEEAQRASDPTADDDRDMQALAGGTTGGTDGRAALNGTDSHQIITGNLVLNPNTN